MEKKIRYVLCNENGSPNLENLFGIAISLGLVSAALVFKNAAYSWLKGIFKMQASMYSVRTL